MRTGKNIQETQELLNWSCFIWLRGWLLRAQAQKEISWDSLDLPLPSAPFGSPAA